MTVVVFPRSIGNVMPRILDTIILAELKRVMVTVISSFSSAANIQSEHILISWEKRAGNCDDTSIGLSCPVGSPVMALKVDGMELSKDNVTEYVSPFCIA